MSLFKWVSGAAFTVTAHSAAATVRMDVNFMVGKDDWSGG